MTWLVDGEEVDNEYFETEQVGNKYTLSLPQVVPEDEGEYTVIAENQFGVVSSTASVTVVKGTEPLCCLTEIMICRIE